MCFRPSEVGGIEHRCPECGTNNLPEATMCANCFAPLEPLDIKAMMAAAEAASAKPEEAVKSAPAAPSAPKAPKAPKAPNTPAAPSAPAPSSYSESLSPTASFGAGDSSADEPAVGEIFSF